jgi:hypothetical protein
MAEATTYSEVGCASSWSASYLQRLRVDFDVDGVEFEAELDKLILEKKLQWSAEHENRIISPIECSRR